VERLVLESLARADVTGDAIAGAEPAARAAIVSVPTTAERKIGFTGGLQFVLSVSSNGSTRPPCRANVRAASAECSSEVKRLRPRGIP
jgi:hypothetical protein